MARDVDEGRASLARKLQHGVQTFRYDVLHFVVAEVEHVRVTHATEEERKQCPTLRCTSRKAGRGKEDAQHGLVLHGGHQTAKGDVVATVGVGHADVHFHDGRIVQRGDGFHAFLFYKRQQGWQLVGSACCDNMAARQPTSRAFSIGESGLPVITGRTHLYAGGRESDMVTAYGVGLGFGDVAQSASGRKDFLRGQPVAVALRLLHLGHGTTDETAVLLLQIVELRQSVTRDERVRIARIDTGDKRVYGIVDERAAQASASQRTHRLVRVGALATPRLTQDAQLVREAEQRGGQSAQGTGGQVVEAVALPDEATLRRVRSNFQQALTVGGGGQVVHQLGHLSSRDGTRRRSRLKYKFILVVGLYLSAYPVTFLHYVNRDATATEPIGSGQSCQSCTYHRHVSGYLSACLFHCVCKGTTVPQIPQSLFIRILPCNIQKSGCVMLLKHPLWLRSSLKTAYRFRLFLMASIFSIAAFVQRS